MDIFGQTLFCLPYSRIIETLNIGLFHFHMFALIVKALDRAQHVPIFACLFLFVCFVFFLLQGYMLRF